MIRVGERLGEWGRTKVNDPVNDPVHDQVNDQVNDWVIMVIATYYVSIGLR